MLNKVFDFLEIFNSNDYYKDLKIRIKNKEYNFIKNSLFKNTLSKNKATVPAVYYIKNTFNGSFYIGSTKNISNRISSHKMNLCLNNHRNSNLQTSFNNAHTNKSFFDICIIFINDREEAFEIEQYLLDYFKDDKNKCNKAIDSKSSSLGLKISDESKQKMRLRKLGIKASNETKQKMSEAHKNRIYSEDHINKIKLMHKYRTYTSLSDEHKKKLSLAGKRRKLSEEHIQILKNGLHIKRKSVIINNIKFNSIKDAVDELKIPKTTIYRRLNDPENINYNYI